MPRLRTPVMMYLFHRIDERLDGHPTMILIDEGWKALDDEIFAARIRDWLKTLRKRNALVGFATQSARDALDSRISTALVRSAEHTSELQSIMRISYSVFCLKQKTIHHYSSIQPINTLK